MFSKNVFYNLIVKGSDRPLGHPRAGEPLQLRLVQAGHRHAAGASGGGQEGRGTKVGEPEENIPGAAEGGDGRAGE